MITEADIIRRINILAEANVAATGSRRPCTAEIAQATDITKTYNETYDSCGIQRTFDLETGLSRCQLAAIRQSPRETEGRIA